MLAVGVEVKPIDESGGDVNIGIRRGIQLTFHRVQRRRWLGEDISKRG